MKNINLNLDLNTLVKKLKTNIAFLFYAAILIVFVMEIFVIYASVKNLLSVQSSLQDLPLQRGVRLNFTEYEAAVKRIEAGKKYLPPPPIFANPFTSR